MECGLRTRLMVREFTRIWMALATKENGSKTNSTVMVMRLGLTARLIRASTKMARSMVKESSRGLMAQPIAGNSMTTILRATVFITGKMAASTKVIGSTTKCRGRVFSSGPTVVTTKATTWTTRRRVMAYFTGRMVASTTVNG
jgi:hypothetical protein